MSRTSQRNQLFNCMMFWKYNALGTHVNNPMDCVLFTKLLLMEERQLLCSIDYVLYCCSSLLLPVHMLCCI